MALNTTINPVERRVMGVQAIRDLIIKSSPKRFGSGGNPRFAAAIINHQAVDRGINSFSPRFRVRVRVCVRS